MPRFTNDQKIPLGQNKRYKKCSLSSFDSQTNFSIFRKSNIWESPFFSIVTSKYIFDIFWLINLFISSIEQKNIQ